MYIDDQARGLTAGIWACSAFTSKMAPHGNDEFMLLLEGAVEIVEPDGNGRITLPASHRHAAGLEKKAVLLGMGNHFELWDAQIYAAQEAEAMKGEMPDVFKDFSF